MKWWKHTGKMICIGIEGWHNPPTITPLCRGMYKYEGFEVCISMKASQLNQNVLSDLVYFSIFIMLGFLLQREIEEFI